MSDSSVHEPQKMGMNKPLIGPFHKIERSQRIEALKSLVGLDASEAKILSGETNVSFDIAEHLIENAIGYFPLPLGVATNFKIDGSDVLIPMAVEETSIIAAASATAKWVRSEGSIRTEALGNVIIGQIQIPQCQDVTGALAILAVNKRKIIRACNNLVPGLVARGGGIRDVILRPLARADGQGEMLVIHILCDPCDAMGANLINQVCEGIKPDIEALTGEKVGLCILSNLVDERLVSAELIIRGIDTSVGHGIQEAAIFAKSDPYRATTHNKGILNGIDPILIATGNDWRAVEAGIHAYAARSGTYQPVSDWKMVGRDLVGRIEIPLAVGIVGGVTKVHPVAKIALKILGVNSASELARICAAVGLVQNLGALKALSTVGIIKGHMRLHAANLAFAAGADASEVSEVSQELGKSLEAHNHISVSQAQEILKKVRERKPQSHQLDQRI